MDWLSWAGGKVIVTWPGHGILERSCDEALASHLRAAACLVSAAAGDGEHTRPVHGLNDP